MCDQMCIRDRRYTKREGKVHKDAVAHVTEGTCRTWPVPDAQSMVKLLGRVTQSKELCIVPGVWHGADGTALFDLVTEGELSSLAAVSYTHLDVYKRQPDACESVFEGGCELLSVNIAAEHRLPRLPSAAYPFSPGRFRRPREPDGEADSSGLGRLSLIHI